MQLTALLIGIALPWLTGALALRLLAIRFSGPGQPGRGLFVAGAGGLLGLAATTWLLRLSVAWNGAFSWWFVITTLALLAVALAWLGRSRSGAGPSLPLPAPGKASTHPWLFFLIGLAILAHVLFSTLELATQPVFPWDGWTVWVYRAKAWFFAEQLTPVVTPEQWLTVSDPQIYSTPARAYPLLPSLVPLWAALSLGAWHEAWVNLPVLAAGLALALALAGLLRLSHVPPIGALIGVYLLVSTPIMGVHLSLGGYGDIWMASFAGLGMATVLAGLIEDRKSLVFLGVVLLILGLGIKVEGWVWLLAAIAVIALARLPGRWLVLSTGGVVGLVLIAVLTGLTVVELPGLGPVGYRDGLLYVPVKGTIALERHDVAAAYRINAFQLGSWHLLWVMVLTLLAGLLFAARSRFARVTAAFLLVFAGLQVAIFVFTAEGAWARDYTAINRMPLQMLPALLYLVVLGADRLLTRAAPAKSRAWLVTGVTGLAIFFASAAAWLGYHNPPNPLEPRAIDGGELRLVAGRGQADGDRFAVEAFQDGIALLSSGPVRIDPEGLSLLRVELDAPLDLEQPELAPAFFWRRADQQRDVSRVTLTRSGLVELSAEPDWRGEIIEVGFLFVDGGEGLPTLESASLEGEDLGNQLSLALDQWTTPQPWSQQSAHFVTGGASNPRISLTALVAVAVLGAALIGTLVAGRAAAPTLLVGLLLSGWLVLDVRWGLERVTQAKASFDDLRGTTIDERRRLGEMGRYTGFIDALRVDPLPMEPSRVLIVRDAGLHRFYGLRSKYDLLPHSSIVRTQLPPASRLGTVDYVLFLGSFTDGNPAGTTLESPRQRWNRLGLGERPDAQVLLERLSQTEEGVLFRVKRTTP
jgi:hypothetical protein